MQHESEIVGQPMPKLTKKQEAFVHAYIETGNAAEAYRRAYDCTNTAQSTIHENACRLLKSSKVAASLAIVRAQVQERLNITVESLTGMLVDDRNQAKQLGQPATAVSAVMGIAKLHGLVIDRSVATNVNLDFADILRQRVAAARSKAITTE